MTQTLVTGGIAQECQGGRRQWFVQMPFDGSLRPFGYPVRCSFKCSVGSCSPGPGKVPPAAGIEYIRAVPGYQELVSGRLIRGVETEPGGGSPKSQDMDAEHGTGRRSTRLLRTITLKNIQGGLRKETGVISPHPKRGSLPPHASRGRGETVGRN